MTVFLRRLSLFFLSFQFEVTATDGGSKVSANRAAVNISVIRNLFPPTFQNEPYTANINFNIAIGNEVTNAVSAVDPDTDVGHIIIISYLFIFLFKNIDIKTQYLKNIKMYGSHM